MQTPQVSTDKDWTVLLVCVCVVGYCRLLSDGDSVTGTEGAVVEWTHGYSMRWMMQLHNGSPMKMRKKSKRASKVGLLGSEQDVDVKNKLKLSRPKNDSEEHCDAQPPAKRACLQQDAVEIKEDLKPSREKKDLKSLCECSTLQSYAKLHRLDKLVSSFLTALKEAFNSSDDITVPSKLSNEWCLDFEVHIATLPARQAHNIFSTLIHHLRRDCVESLELDPQDSVSVKIIPFISQLVCIYLRGVHMADHTVSILRVKRFAEQMSDFQTLLGRLGSALLHKEHDRTLMVSFLSCCLAWGDLHTVLIYYHPDEETFMVPQLTQTDSSATNLSGLHSYLTDDQWSLVAQRITNFGEAMCRHLLNQLILQKLHAMILFNDEACKDASKLAAKHLVSHVDDDNLLLVVGNNGLMLTSKLDTAQVLALAAHLVQNVACMENCSVEEFKNPGFQENRKLVLALVATCLHDIGQLFATPKRKRDSIGHQASTVKPQLVRDVFAWLDSNLILEMGQRGDTIDSVTSKVISNMANSINDYLENDLDAGTSSSSLKVDYKVLDRYLTILRALPLEYLTQKVQAVVFCCIIALAVSLESNRAKDDKQKPSTVKMVQKDLMLGLLDGCSMPNMATHLHPGRLLRWLSRANLQLDQSHRRKLFQLLTIMSLREVSTLTMLEAGMPLLAKNVPLTVEHRSAANMELAVVMLQTMSKDQKLSPCSEANSLCRKMQRNLASNLTNIVNCGIVADDESDKLLLEAYHAILQTSLGKKDTPNLEKKTKHLDTFIKIALPGVVDNDELSLAFTALLLKHRIKLGNSLPADFIPEAWLVLANSDQVTEHHKILLEVANREEFDSILKELIVSMTEATAKSSPDCSSVEKCCALWTSVVTAHLDEQKGRLRHRSLVKLNDVLLAATQLGHIADIKPILLFNLTVVNSHQIKLQQEMLGFCLESITVIPTQDLSTILVALQLLSAMLSHCSALVLDLIPAFLQRYSHLVAVVAKLGRQGAALDHTDNRLLEACALQLEKLANSMVSHSKHFQRIASYVVADILRQFELLTLRPDVKLHFLNAVYSFLRICDTHSIAYLTHALAPASKQIFQTVYDTYMKHYHFTGRV